MQDVFNLITICRTNTIQVLNLRGYFSFMLCPSGDILDINEKHFCWQWGPLSGTGRN